MIGHDVAPGTTLKLAGDGVFAYDSAVLLSKAQKVLLRLVKGIHGKRHVTCTGFTDFGGDSPQHETDLGLARAKAVCAFLKAHGLASVTKAKTRGASAPLVTKGDHPARASNRRVEITIGH